MPLARRFPKQPATLVGSDRQQHDRLLGRQTPPEVREPRVLDIEDGRQGTLDDIHGGREPFGHGQRPGEVAELCVSWG